MQPTEPFTAATGRLERELLDPSTTKVREPTGRYASWHSTTVPISVPLDANSTVATTQAAASPSQLDFSDRLVIRIGAAVPCPGN